MAAKQSNEHIQITPGRLLNTLTEVLPAGLNILVVGAPGLGKTEIIQEACRQCDMDVIMFHPVISDPTDFKGMPGLVPGENGDYRAEFFTFSNLKRLVDVERPTVAFADDLGQAPPLVQAAWMQLVLGGQLEDKRISDKVTFLSATNRKEDKAGVQGIIEPLKSRFASIVELVADVDEWLHWARRNHIHPMVRGFIRFRPQLLHAFSASNDMTNSPSPRTVKHVSDLMWACRNTPDAIMSVLVAGAAGSGFSVEFMTYRSLARSFPKLSVILKAPKRAPLPKEQSAMFAIVEAMLDKSDAKTISPFMQYILRLPKEFQAWYYEQVKEINPKLVRTEAMTKWAVAHGIE